MSLGRQIEDGSQRRCYLVCRDKGNDCLDGSRDGNKTRTYLEPTKSAPFKTQMGDENGFLTGMGQIWEKRTRKGVRVWV